MLRFGNVTVAAVRKELEGRGKIFHVSTRTDTLGRQQPARKHVKTQHIPEEADEGELFKTVKLVRADRAAFIVAICPARLCLLPPKSRECHVSTGCGQSWTGSDTAYPRTPSRQLALI